MSMIAVLCGSFGSTWLWLLSCVDYVDTWVRLLANVDNSDACVWLLSCVNHFHPWVWLMPYVDYLVTSKSFPCMHHLDTWVWWLPCVDHLVAWVLLRTTRHHNIANFGYPTPQHREQTTRDDIFDRHWFIGSTSITCGRADKFLWC